MAGLNKVMLIGHLGNDPEIRALESGVKVARFSVATTESYKDRNTGERKDQTEWHNVTLWRGLAEVAERFLRKGSQVYIEGKIQTRQYQDKDGITKYATDIVGREMTMLGGRGEGGAAPMASDSSSSAPAQAAPSVDQGSDSDDLPF